MDMATNNNWICQEARKRATTRDTAAIAPQRTEAISSRHKREIINIAAAMDKGIKN